MKIHGWAYAKERVKVTRLYHWVNSKSPSGKDLGVVYAVKFPIIGKFSIIKIGATGMPEQRLQNFGNRCSIYCVSPLHTNFFENEEILHKHFDRYRIPGRRNCSQPEYFNMSIPFFLSHLPELDFKKE